MGPLSPREPYVRYSEDVEVDKGRSEWCFIEEGEQGGQIGLFHDRVWFKHLLSFENISFHRLPILISQEEGEKQTCCLIP